MEIVGAAFFQLLFQLPLFAVWIVGVVLAVSRQRDNPAGFRLVAIAFVLFIIMTFVSTVTNISVPMMASQNGMSVSQIGVIFGALNLVYTIISTISWVLLLIALFRRPRITTESSFSEPVKPF